MQETTDTEIWSKKQISGIILVQAAFVDATVGLRLDAPSPIDYVD